MYVCVYVCVCVCACVCVCMCLKLSLYQTISHRAHVGGRDPFTLCVTCLIHITHVCVTWLSHMQRDQFQWNTRQKIQVFIQRSHSAYVFGWHGPCPRVCDMAHLYVTWRDSFMCNMTLFNVIHVWKSESLSNRFFESLSKNKKSEFSSKRFCEFSSNMACVLQCVTVCCSVLQCIAVCCSVLQCVTVCCSVLQCVAVRCSVLQCVTVCCIVLQCIAVCGENSNTLQNTAIRYNLWVFIQHGWCVLQCVLQCVFQCVLLRVLQCVLQI